jgi:hypothetical protein
MMQPLTRLFPVVAAAVLALTGCVDPLPPRWHDLPGTVRLDLGLHWNGAPMALGDTVTDHLGHPVTLTNVQFYLNGLELQDLDGTWHSVGDIRLVDFNRDAPTVVEEVPPGTYTAMRFGVGIPKSLNTNIDPASYPNDHPLSFQGSAGMFWTWSTGYIFFKYEGKAGTAVGEPIEAPISYHLGTDLSYRTITLPFAYPMYVTAREVLPIPVAFDGARLLDGPAGSIDVIEDPVSHNAPGTELPDRLLALLETSFYLP